MTNLRQKISSLSPRKQMAAALLGLGLIAVSSLSILSLFLKTPSQDPQAYNIEQVISTEARMGRDGLLAIKSLPKNAGKQQVFQVVGQPMVRLSSLSTKETGVLEQYAYPLAFDPASQIVLLFRADATGAFVGYRFAFNGTIPRKS
jgi:hypothetical protein